MSVRLGQVDAPPKLSIQLYGIYLGPKVVTWEPSWGLSIYWKHFGPKYILSNYPKP